ncbi:MAG: substrate-binding periplasmic protein [Pyrinomonadaceae bacterium]
MALSRPVAATLIFALSLIGFSCGELPKDQHGTVDAIARTGRMRIGLIENPPWVIRTNGEPSGAEVELMRQFASQMGAEPEWHWGGDEDLFGALEMFELDAVAGGISDKTPWSKRIGITRYYFRENFDVGVPTGAPIDDVKGKTIAVSDRRLAGLITHEGGTPVMVASLRDLPQGLPVAAADWQLAQIGLTKGGSDLHYDDHVIAVPPGENQLVKRLEEFLSAQSADIPVLLARQPEVIQ